MVGNRAVLVQDFNADLRPTDINFDRMSIWVRIYNLPFGLMNKTWGEDLARKFGSLEKVDVDAQGRAWGPFLRAKVLIDITKPLRHGVSIFSKKRQSKEWYEVRYEKLPNYCYSCGIIGHSSVECPTPAERDENGLLPYSVDLRAPDEKKKKMLHVPGGQSPCSSQKYNNTMSCHESVSDGPDHRPSNSQEKDTSLSGQQYMGTNNEEKDEQAPSVKNHNKSGSYRTVRTNPKKSKVSGKVSAQDQNINTSSQGKKKKASEEITRGWQ